MAVAADIPPELFTNILGHVCWSSYMLLDPDHASDIPGRKEVIQTIGACSLTCVYWARICRAHVFTTIWLKSHEDMCALSLLVANTPKAFPPISTYVRRATLLYRIGDRPWLHLAWLQWTQFPLAPGISISYRIVDVPIASNFTTPRRPIYSRLFSGLPRSLPSSCQRCDELTIVKPHFQDFHDIKSLLNKFSYRAGPDNHLRLFLCGVSWEAEPHFQNDTLTETTLGISSLCSVEITIQASPYAAQTAFLAYIALMRRMKDMFPSAAPHRDANMSMRLLLPAQRTILNVGTLVCQNDKVEELVISTDLPGYSSLRKKPAMQQLCSMTAGTHKNNVDIDVKFYSSEATVASTEETSSFIMVDHISVVRVYIHAPSTTSSSGSHSPNGSSTGPEAVISYPWEEIIELCAADEEFEALEWCFPSFDFLTYFVARWREALTKLGGRNYLAFKEGNSEWRSIDFQDLESIGGTPHLS